MPAMRAVAKTFPFAILFSAMSAIVSALQFYSAGRDRFARADRLGRDIDHPRAAILGHV